MFRKIIALAVIVSLAACNAASEVRELNPDDRFDLLPLVMKPILRSDVEKCVSLSRFSKDYKVGESVLFQKGFDLGVDFWVHVEDKFLKGSNLPDGFSEKLILTEQNAGGVTSIFPKKTSVSKNSELCGQYAGELVVKLGLLSLSESLEMAEEQQPGLLKEMGYNLDDLLVNLKVIEEQAANLSDVPDEEKVSCVASYQALRFEDVKFEPYSNIWRSALVRAIESGEVLSGSFGDENEYWQALKLQGPIGLKQIDGAGEFVQQCENWLNGAISKQQASK